MTDKQALLSPSDIKLIKIYQLVLDRREGKQPPTGTINAIYELFQADDCTALSELREVKRQLEDIREMCEDDSTAEANAFSISQAAYRAHSILNKLLPEEDDTNGV